MRTFFSSKLVFGAVVLMAVLTGTCGAGLHALATEAASKASAGTFEPIVGPWSGPGVESWPAHINNRGDVAGTYDEGYLTVPHAFVKLHDCRSGEMGLDCGKAFTLDAPGAGADYRAGTYGVSINDRGTVLAWYGDPGDIRHGALWRKVCDRGECTWEFQSFDAPGAGKGPDWRGPGTMPSAMSEDGAITGTYIDDGMRSHAFVAVPHHHEGDDDHHHEGDDDHHHEGDDDKDRSNSPIVLDFSEILLPGQTTMYGITMSSNGIVVGEGCDDTSCEAYVRSQKGKITVFGNLKNGNIQPESVNSSGTIVGTIYHSTSPDQAFFRTPNGTLTIAPSFPVGTLNDRGIMLILLQNGAQLRLPDGAVENFTIPISSLSVRALANLSNTGWTTGAGSQSFVWKLY